MRFFELMYSKAIIFVLFLMLSTGKALYLSLVFYQYQAVKVSHQLGLSMGASSNLVASGFFYSRATPGCS
jgi:hypothetical protein